MAKASKTKTSPGEKHGRLTAIEDVGSQQNTRIWKFRCDCGSEVELPASRVRYGSTRSCGCLANELTSQRKSGKYAGIRSGRLVAIKPIGKDSHGHIKWECKCDCGNFAYVEGYQVNRGRVSSCGCLQREAISRLGSSGKQENPYSRTSEYRAKMRKRLRRDPAKSVSERISRVMSFAMQKLGQTKGGQTFELLGYTPKELADHLERQFLPGMSWENRGEWQIDHIIPISSAENKDDVIRLNQLSNLRPLWSGQNNSKKDRQETLL